MAAIVAWAVWPKRMPPPRETDRVWHPDGYSIIAPRDWKTSLETEQKTLNSSNRGWLKAEPATPGYYPPSLTINVLREPPDAEKLKSDKHFTDGTFHGLPALIASAPAGKYWAYKIVFQDRDRWFEMTLSTPDYEDAPKSSWWGYLDSFNYDPQKSNHAAATTKPALEFTTTFPTTAPGPGPEAAPVH